MKAEIHAKCYLFILAKYLSLFRPTQLQPMHGWFQVWNCKKNPCDRVWGIEAVAPCSPGKLPSYIDQSQPNL